MNVKIEQFLKESVNRNIFPGCCVAIIHDQTTEYYCVGYKATYPYQEANKIDTLYDLASLTKVVGTTPAILRFIQSGGIHYHTPVYTIIPEFKNRDITLFHLLTHTSGLPADFDWEMTENKEVIIQRICEFSNQVVPEKEVIYSDLGYIILGYILEKISNQSLDQVIESQVLKPLEMYDTKYCPTQINKCAPTEYSSYVHHILQGEVHDHKAIMMNGIAGHAGLFSHIFDLEHYAQMILDNGKYKNQTFLEEQYIHDMFTNFSLKNQVPRGIGFLTYTPDSLFSSLNSTKTIAHTGFTGTSILIDQENQIAIIVLSNRVHPTRENTEILNWRREFHDFVMKHINDDIEN